jgi:nitroimidazol reductase NimA-like FMN-containing flavoprotein (pyridoxamine 5'-phosphate oxidase superfamily)
MLPWSWAVERLERALNYWVSTTRPDGRPHAMPVWGAWLDGILYIEGDPETRRLRNLAANPAVVAHLESGDEVVIIEGVAEELRAPDRELTTRLAAIFRAKYKPKGYEPEPESWDGGGLHGVRPRVAFAWGPFPTTLTRWRFE